MNRTAERKARRITNFQTAFAGQLDKTNAANVKTRTGKLRGIGQKDPY